MHQPEWLAFVIYSLLGVPVNSLEIWFSLDGGEKIKFNKKKRLFSTLRSSC